MLRMTTTSATLPDPIAELWRQARHWLADAMRDLRGPVGVACTFARDALSAIRSRLVLIEALLLKLLLIEAARVAAPAPSRHNTEAAMRCAATAGSKPVLRQRENPADPSTWRVRFHLPVPRPRKHAGSTPAPALGADGAGPRDRAKARWLARRFEALRRVFADPRPVIFRLARRLASLGAGAYAAARRIALARVGRSRGEGPTFADALVRAHDHCAVFRHDSS
jgi:hypothetical protein